MTLNARQVRAAARRPARGGRARRSAFRLRHGGGARDGEHDRPDVEGANDVEFSPSADYEMTTAALTA